MIDPSQMVAVDIVRRALSSHTLAQQQAQHASQNFDAYRNAAPQPEPYKMRTREEILAQLEARFAQMEAEAAKPERIHPCERGKWHRDGLFEPFDACAQPLVMGVDGLPRYLLSATEFGGLCGPERALWEQRKPWWRRLVDWFVAPFVDGGE